jgi:hypothetical protein
VFGCFYFPTSLGHWPENLSSPQTRDRLQLEKHSQTISCVSVIQRIHHCTMLTTIRHHSVECWNHSIVWSSLSFIFPNLPPVTYPVLWGHFLWFRFCGAQVLRGLLSKRRLQPRTGQKIQRFGGGPEVTNMKRFEINLKHPELNFGKTCLISTESVIERHKHFQMWFVLSNNSVQQSAKAKASKDLE